VEIKLGYIHTYEHAYGTKDSHLEQKKLWKDELINWKGAEVESKISNVILTHME
jgi:hypothetical protein